MDHQTSGARPKTAEASGYAPPGATSDLNGLPITPSREVSLSQATWERLDQAGYRMGLTQDDRNTPARDERQAPRDERSAHDQAAVGKEPTSIRGSRHLYDYLGRAPVDPRGTLSEGSVYHGAGDQLRSDRKPAWDYVLRSGREPDKPFIGPPTQVEERLFRLTGPLLEWARTGVRPDARRGSSYPCRPDSSHPARPQDQPWTSYQGNDSRRPNLKAQVYDGSKPLAEYLSHFRVVAAVNRWSEYEKGLYLAASLAGPAQRLLTRVDIYSPGGYEVLLDALRQRYAPRHQEELHRADLKTRRQHKEESLRALADSIEVAVEKAYPQADPDTTNQLCLEYYLGAVKDPRVRQWVHTRGPTDLRHAVALALQSEAFFKGEDLRTPLRTRAVLEEPREEWPRWDEDTEEFIRAMRTRPGYSAAPRNHSGGDRNQSARPPPNQPSSGSTGISREEVAELIREALAAWVPARRPYDKSNMECRNCGELGHFARECQSQQGITRVNTYLEN